MSVEQVLEKMLKREDEYAQLKRGEGWCMWHIDKYIVMHQPKYKRTRCVLETEDLFEALFCLANL